jgi:hypothetical protein
MSRIMGHNFFNQRCVDYNGYVSFIIARKLGSVERKFTDFEITVISIFLSIVNYIPFRIWSGKTTWDEITIALQDPMHLSQIIIITIAVGLALGGLFKLIFTRNQVVGTLWPLTFKDASRIHRKDLKEAEKAQKEAPQLWIIVGTEKEEYMGRLVAWGQSAETEEREVLIRNPRLVKRDASAGKYESAQLLAKDDKTPTYMLFTSEDIKHVIIYYELYPEKSADRNFLSEKIESLGKSISLKEGGLALAIWTLAAIAAALFVIIYIIITLAGRQ